MSDGGKGLPIIGKPYESEKHNTQQIYIYIDAIFALVLNF